VGKSSGNVPPKAKDTRSTQAQGIEFHKLHARTWELRDAYHWMLTLRWPQFSLFVLGVYLAINLVFGLAYYLRPNCIAEMTPGSWGDAFFFSVETLATVGYGHMYPATTYAHLVATAEIMTGMFGLAIITGLIFIRFSRPIARVVFSKVMVLSPFNGQPALMWRVANLRDEAMAEAEFRIILLRNEPTREDESMRRFYPLKLQFDRLILFPAVVTIRHIIDEESPLHGRTLADLEREDTRLTTSVVCIDSVIPAAVQSHNAYTWRDIRENHRFAEVYRFIGENSVTVDYSLLHETEPIPKPPPTA
jgi:inward rectifier potassium channel